MLDRNLSYLSLVEVLYGYPIDGVVLTTGCDKTTPAALMAAATVNIPAIVLSGGPMLDGNYKGGKKDGLWTDWLERKEGTYKGGEKDGLWTWWDEQGNITQQITYKNGEEIL